MSIKEKYRHFKQLQVNGRHAEKRDVESMPEHTCINCGTEFHGDYCPVCGQKSGISRIDFHGAVVTYFEGFFSSDSTFSHTMLELLYRPGYMIRDYIRGHRSEYFTPVKLLFMLVTTLVFLQFLLNSPTFNFWYENLKGNMPHMADGSTSVLIDTLSNVLSNVAFCNMLNAFIGVLPLWLIFRRTKVGRETNLAETFFLNVYIECISTFIAILSCFLKACGCDFIGIDTFSGMALNVLFTLLVLHQFYQLKLWKSILLCILYHIIFLLLIVIIMLIVILVINIASGTFFAHPDGGSNHYTINFK